MTDRLEEVQRCVRGALDLLERGKCRDARQLLIQAERQLEELQ